MPYGEVLKALYTYEAAAEDEMSFNEDELLCIIKDGAIEHDENWLLACSLKSETGQTGLVPANYVEPVPI